MPTYQYSCKDCGHAFETVQSFSEDSLTVCPQCEGALRKVYNAVGVVFKGSGFYRNDSRPKAAAENGASTSSDSGTSTKTDTKTEAKSETKSESKSGTKSGSSSAPAASSA